MTSGSMVPLVGIFAASDHMVVLMAVLSGVVLTVEAVRLRVPRLNVVLVHWLRPLLKESEQGRITGATYIALSALFAFLLFDKSVAIAALFFLAVGDPIAALVGRRMPGPRLIGKSPLGTVAFFLAAMAIVGVLSAGDAVAFHWGLVAGAAIAALVELLPLPLDDNLTVPLVCGAAMTLMGV